MKFITAQDIKLSHFKVIVDTLSIDESLQKILIENLKKILVALPSKSFDRGDAHRLRVVFETLLQLMFVDRNQGHLHSKKHTTISEKIKLITDRYADSQAHDIYTHLTILKGYGNIFSHSDVEPNSKLMIFGALMSVYQVLFFLKKNKKNKQVVKIQKAININSKQVVQVNKNNQNKSQQNVQKNNNRNKGNNINKPKEHVPSQQTKVKKHSII